MKLSRVMEALGLGVAREARVLVARLPKPGMTVATNEEPVARALVRARHQRAPLEGASQADAAIALLLPDGDEALVLLDRLAAATRSEGLVLVAGSLRGKERARIAGLFLRAGLAELQQTSDGSTLFTAGRVRRLRAVQ